MGSGETCPAFVGGQAGGGRRAEWGGELEARAPGLQFTYRLTYFQLCCTSRSERLKECCLLSGWRAERVGMRPIDYVQVAGPLQLAPAECRRPSAGRGSLLRVRAQGSKSQFTAHFRTGESESAVYSIFVIFLNSSTARQRLSDWLQHLRTVRHH
jgi:hypothetical protein